MTGLHEIPAAASVREWVPLNRNHRGALIAAHLVAFIATPEIEYCVRAAARRKVP